MAGKKKGAFKRLLSLGREKVGVINGMLMSNESVQEVARMIQEDWSQYTDVSQDSLAKQLTRYRNTELLAAPATQESPVSGKEKSEVLERLNDKVDVIAGMNELIQLQRQRILKTVAKEDKIGMAFQWLTKDITALQGMYVQMQNMEFENGLRVRVPKDNSLHVVPHEGSESYERYMLEKQQHQEVSKATLDVLHWLDAEYEIVDSQDQDGAGAGTGS